MQPPYPIEDIWWCTDPDELLKERQCVHSRNRPDPATHTLPGPKVFADCTVHKTYTVWFSFTIESLDCNCGAVPMYNLQYMALYN